MSQPINPYASPQAANPFVPPAPQAPVPVVVPYQSTRGKTIFAIAMAGIVIVMQFLLAGSAVLQLQLLESGRSTGGIDPAAAAANDARHVGLSQALIVVGIISFIALLVWIYAVHRNLPALGATGLEFTPGWAVGWFFVPILNLFKPCQALFEIWNGSDPARLPRQDLDASVQSGAIVGWWWGLRIIAALVGQLFAVYARQSSSIEELVTVTWITIVVIFVLDIPTNICEIVILRTVERNQEVRHRLMEGSVARPEMKAAPIEAWPTFR